MSFNFELSRFDCTKRIEILCEADTSSVLFEEKLYIVRHLLTQQDSWETLLIFFN